MNKQKATKPNNQKNVQLVSREGSCNVNSYICQEMICQTFLLNNLRLKKKSNVISKSCMNLDTSHQERQIFSSFRVLLFEFLLDQKGPMLPQEA